MMHLAAPTSFLALAALFFSGLPCPAVGAASLLSAVGIEKPAASVFPSRWGHRLPPAHTEIVGPKGTNKFWANWVVNDGVGLSIFPQPWALRWGSTSPGASPDLLVSQGQEPNKEWYQKLIRMYYTPFTSEFSLGAPESTGSEGHVVVKEGLFGVHMQLRGPSGTFRKITYPIFSGMAYISGLYEGGFTPRVGSHRKIMSIRKVRSGVWSFENGGGVEFRVYALTRQGDFVDNTYNFHNFDGEALMNKPLEGWVRVGKVLEPGHEEVLDAHAGAILVGWDLNVEDGGLVQYKFDKVGNSSTKVVHFGFAHHLDLLAEGNERTGLTSKSATKGTMTGVLGDVWTLHADLAEAAKLGFLPERQPNQGRRDFLASEAVNMLQWFKQGRNAVAEMFDYSYYFTGKGFQKVGMVCLLLDNFFGRDHKHTQDCADLLDRGFRCLYDPDYKGDCGGAPAGQVYDEEWGGVPSQTGYHDDGCYGVDFGNACYNDHHYHYGYFVVAGAILAKLRPTEAANADFVSYVETLIRDTANPSPEDPFFPVFRAFDWFDLHSWSRGVAPSKEGKDQESTSEELNLLYGMHLWGTVLDKPQMRKLGTTMLTFCAKSIRQFFLLEDGNTVHPADFVRNRVTGIFFQNKVDYTTWFGTKEEYIHGIQMLPLSPALQLTRTPRFCQAEWDDKIARLLLSPLDPWTSILLTGTLAVINPDAAYDKLLAMRSEHMDDGLTRVWALYWAAVQAPPQTQQIQKLAVLQDPALAVTPTPTATQEVSTVNLTLELVLSISDVTVALQAHHGLQAAVRDALAGLLNMSNAKVHVELLPVNISQPQAGAIMHARVILEISADEDSAKSREAVAGLTPEQVTWKINTAGTLRGEDTRGASPEPRAVVVRLGLAKQAEERASEVRLIATQ